MFFSARRRDGDRSAHFAAVGGRLGGICVLWGYVFSKGSKVDDFYFWYLIGAEQV